MVFDGVQPGIYGTCFISQATVIQGCTSSFETISAGVPQGAILSPLFFSVYVNDIHSCSVFDGNINLFADDTSAYVTSRSSTVSR